MWSIRVGFAARTWSVRDNIEWIDVAIRLCEEARNCYSLKMETDVYLQNHTYLFLLDV